MVTVYTRIRNKQAQVYNTQFAVFWDAELHFSAPASDKIEKYCDRIFNSTRFKPHQNAKYFITCGMNSTHIYLHRQRTDALLFNEVILLHILALKRSKPNRFKTNNVFILLHPHLKIHDHNFALTKRNTFCKRRYGPLTRYVSIFVSLYMPCAIFWILHESCSLLHFVPLLPTTVTHTLSLNKTFFHTKILQATRSCF